MEKTPVNTPLTPAQLIAGLQDLAAEAKTMVDADGDYSGTFQRDYDVCTQAAELIRTI